MAFADFLTALLEYANPSNKIAPSGKKKKLSSAELRKNKKDRMARRKRGEEVFTDEDE
ncbi:hypothetical protein B0J11DRAFT_578876 [Dendryphion nanum]|uniref:Uncharacterized protein n=1 Tax=Dendryphion nanum TaxID=256645 RepID=A0A9P9E138_9PLEO|nr:hypothetical protein B0J11DRAFT_578876 [Dendryphion nanum]